MTARAKRVDRALAALPLALLYLLFCSLYLWQAGQRLTPTIFSDELELAQLSRSIAETGESARRGEPYGFQSVYTILLAPVWWIDDTESAFAAAKYVGVLVMTSAIFPAYLLARLVVAKPWALFAAAGSVAIPGLAYSSFLLEEPLAYPTATAALWLLARFTAAPGVVTLAPALAISIAAPLVRSQLAIVPAALALCLLALAWLSVPARNWRAAWTRWDWAGAVVLAIGATLATSAVLGHASESWYVTTAFWKGRLVEYGLWAIGALAIGVGGLPLVGGLAAVFVRDRGDGRVRAFAITAAAAFICFGMYAAVKAAYLSTVFATRVLERNVIYLAPVLFAGTALLLERPRSRPWALAGAAVLVLYLVTTTPYELASYPYGDAPSLAMAALGNRELAWGEAAIERALVVTVLAGVALLVARNRLRGRPAAAAGALAASGVLAWTLTAEVYAARGFRAQADLLYANLPAPVDWLDETTGGEPAVYLGQSIDDANGIWLLEFWNRSLRKVWSMDGTAPGPGPTLSPDLAALDGTLSPQPDVRWVVAESEVDLAARKVGSVRAGLQLYRLEGPLRLESSTSGVKGDGWMGAAASYTQFQARGSTTRGFAKAFLVNPFCPSVDRPAKVTARIGGVVVENKQPALAPGYVVRRGVLRSCNRGLTFFAPARVPFRIEIEIDPTFSPATLDARSSDTRELSARPAFEFVPLRGGEG